MSSAYHHNKGALFFETVLLLALVAFLALASVLWLGKRMGTGLEQTAESFDVETQAGGTYANPQETAFPPPPPPPEPTVEPTMIPIVYPDEEETPEIVYPPG